MPNCQTPQADHQLINGTFGFRNRVRLLEHEQFCFRHAALRARTCSITDRRSSTCSPYRADLSARCTSLCAVMPVPKRASAAAWCCLAE